MPPPNGDSEYWLAPLADDPGRSGGDSLAPPPPMTGVPQLGVPRPEPGREPPPEGGYSTGCGVLDGEGV